MRGKQLIITVCVSAAMGVLPAASAFAAMVRECPTGKPTAASYTWNFRREANNLFSDVQTRALHAEDHAYRLQSFLLDANMSWQSDVNELIPLRSEVNRMGNDLCRLETIRRVLAPWQQRSVDRIHATIQLLADNTQDAITFENGHHQMLWSPTYQKYVDNIARLTRSLTNSSGNAVEYAKVRSQYRDLRGELGAKTAS